MELTSLPIEKLAPLLRTRRVSPVELTRAFLARIARLNPVLNAYITVTAKRALADARRAEAQIMRGKYRGPLHGIPISLKDNIETAGIRTTAGSKILATNVPDYDALIAYQLAEAGCILLGKTNLHEFAYGVSTENPHYGPTRNPWDTTRIPGGSSGGSAAAIAAGLCCASIGTDTGGSVRIPAAHCGIVGLKTSYDVNSLRGLVPLAKSLDTVGPLARTVADAATLIRATVPFADRDRRWAAASRREFLVMPALPARKRGKLLHGIVLGLARDYFFEWIDSEVRRAVEAAIEDCQHMGARVIEVALPGMARSDEAGTQIALAEASAYHAAQGWFPARAEEYGEDVRKRLEMGMDIRATDYLAAKESQASIRQETLNVFRKVHALVAPVAPMAATEIGAKTASVCGRDEPVRAALLRLNRPANFTGIPAIAVPCGFTQKNLPIGLQLMGQPYGELDLCAIARVYEQAHEWHARRSPL